MLQYAQLTLDYNTLLKGLAHLGFFFSYKEHFDFPIQECSFVPLGHFGCLGLGVPRHWDIFLNTSWDGLFTSLCLVMLVNIPTTFFRLYFDMLILLRHGSSQTPYFNETPLFPAVLFSPRTVTWRQIFKEVSLVAPCTSMASKLISWRHVTAQKRNSDADGLSDPK